MQYYRRNLGDYAKKAGRLSILQHGVYNLLIDACYDRECFPTREEAIDWVWASTPEEVHAVEFVLSKFFELIDGVYVQGRIQEELAEYHKFCEEQAEKGKKGGRPKKPKGLNKKPVGLPEKPDGKPMESQRGPEKTLTTNHYPLTTNHQPLENTSGADAPVAPTFEDFWAVYPRHKDRTKAEAKWKKLKITPEVFAMITKNIHAMLASGDWDNPKFIPYPTTYLNGKRWEDEVTPRGNHDQPNRKLSLADRTQRDAARALAAIGETYSDPVDPYDSTVRPQVGEPGGLDDDGEREVLDGIFTVVPKVGTSR